MGRESGGRRRENGAEAGLCTSAPKFGFLVEIIITIKEKNTSFYFFFPPFSVHFGALPALCGPHVAMSALSRTR